MKNKKPSNLINILNADEKGIIIFDNKLIHFSIDNNKIDIKYNLPNDCKLFYYYPDNNKNNNNNNSHVLELKIKQNSIEKSIWLSFKTQELKEKFALIFNSILNDKKIIINDESSSSDEYKYDDGDIGKDDKSISFKIKLSQDETIHKNINETILIKNKRFHINTLEKRILLNIEHCAIENKKMNLNQLILKYKKKSKKPTIYYLNFLNSNDKNHFFELSNQNFDIEKQKKANKKKAIALESSSSFSLSTTGEENETEPQEKNVIHSDTENETDTEVESDNKYYDEIENIIFKNDNEQIKINVKFHMEDERETKKGTITLVAPDRINIQIGEQNIESLNITNDTQLKINKKNMNLIHLFFPDKKIDIVISSLKDKQLLIKSFRELTNQSEIMIYNSSDSESDTNFDKNDFIQDINELNSNSAKDENYSGFYLSDENGGKIDKCEIQIIKNQGIIKIINSLKGISIYTIKSKLQIYRHPTIKCLLRFKFNIIKEKLYLLAPTKKLREEIIKNILPLIYSKKERFLIQIKDSDSIEDEFKPGMMDCLRNTLQLMDFKSNDKNKKVEIKKFNYIDLELRTNEKKKK